ncbi:MAG: PLP-dependent aminotransferase family protein [Nibricoccus sp.]
MNTACPADRVETPLQFSSLGRRSEAPTIARVMTMALQTPGLLSLAAGFTDNGSLPVEAVRVAMAELEKRAGEPEYLQYGSNQGRPALRGLLAEHLIEKEPDLRDENLAEKLLITNGSQQALYLAMQVLCDPGDIVLVDRPSYFVFLEMLSSLGVKARSLPVDMEGRIDGPALERLLRGLAERGESQRLKAVYFVSYFCNPSSRCMTENDKTTIAEVLAAHGLNIPVIEDGAYRELYFREAFCARSVLSLPAWGAFPKLYLETLTKPFATGLKVGYGVCSHRPWLEKMLHVKGCHDFGTANFNQALFERVLANGGYAAQIAKIRPLYETKMRCLHDALIAGGLDRLGWRWDVPAGGLYLWLEAPHALDTATESSFCKACIAEGVLYVPGDLCFGDEAPRNFLRLSFGVLAVDELREAARRFIRVAKRFS